MKRRLTIIVLALAVLALVAVARLFIRRGKQRLATAPVASRRPVVVRVAQAGPARIP